MIFVVQRRKSENRQDEQQANLVLAQNIQEKARAIDLEKNYETKVLNNEKFLSHMTDGGRQLTAYILRMEK